MKSTGLDVRDVAYHAGVSQDYIYKILRNGRPNISAVNTAEIARVLGVSVDYLMGMSDVLAVDGVLGNNAEETAEYLDISPERLSWLQDKCRGLTIITRDLDRLQEKEAEAIVMHIDSHLKQIHDLVSDGVRLGSLFANFEEAEKVNEVEE